MKQWLSFYHPSTATFVDDKKGFLKALKHRLPSHLIATYFSNPLNALLDIKNHDSFQYESLHPLFSMDEQLYESETHNSETYFGLRLDEIFNTACDAKRFSTQSVVIVDCMMPEIDGINFCRQLKEYPIKKIMLTANSDHTMAVKAFNEKIIDYFLLKDSPNLIPELTRAIEEMQQNYFNSLIERKLGGVLGKTVPLLNNPFMVDFYEKLMRELNATEHYLLDRWGSMVFLGRDGTPTTLIISPASVLDTYAAIAEDQDYPKTAEALLTRKKLLFFPTKMDCMRPVSDWSAFLLDANPINHESDLFYSIIRNPDIQPLSAKHIQSQENYQKELSLII